MLRPSQSICLKKYVALGLLAAVPFARKRCGRTSYIARQGRRGRDRRSRTVVEPKPEPEVHLEHGSIYPFIYSSYLWIHQPIFVRVLFHHGLYTSIYTCSEPILSQEAETLQAKQFCLECGGNHHRLDSTEVMAGSVAQKL